MATLQTPAQTTLNVVAVTKEWLDSVLLNPEHKEWAEKNNLHQLLKAELITTMGEVSKIDESMRKSLGIPSGVMIALREAGTPWGWKRDLTMECVEPNPGPFWDDIKRTLVDTKLGGPDRVNKFFSTHLQNFEEELYKLYPQTQVIHDLASCFDTLNIPTCR
jgi:hypothetical protein